MSDVSPYVPFLLRGLLVSIEVTAIGLAIAIVVAFVAGLGRMSHRKPVRLLAGAFVEVFRGTSVVVQLFWFFYALPILGLQLSPMEAAVWALGLNQGAYGAEIVRGAIQGLPPGQDEAGVALGMSRTQRLRRIILPQALPAMLPPAGNQAIDLFKATSLVSLVTVSDLTFRSQMVRSATGETAVIFGLILVWYFIVSYLISLLVRWLETRVQIDKPDVSPPFWRALLSGIGGKGAVRP